MEVTRHFTATAFVVDSRKRALLLWHKRLGRWMPAGGHVDENELPEDAAKRECKEETGLDVEILGLGSGLGETEADLFTGNPAEGRMLKKPLALLLEEIPASKERNEPAHQHMDFLYLARPLDETQVLRMAEAEASDMRWFTRDEVAALDDTREIFSNVKTYVLHCLS